MIRPAQLFSGSSATKPAHFVQKYRPQLSRDSAIIESRNYPGSNCVLLHACVYLLGWQCWCWELLQEMGDPMLLLFSCCPPFEAASSHPTRSPLPFHVSAGCSGELGRHDGGSPDGIFSLPCGLPVHAASKHHPQRQGGNGCVALGVSCAVEPWIVGQHSCGCLLGNHRDLSILKHHCISNAVSRSSCFVD